MSAVRLNCYPGESMIRGDMSVSEFIGVLWENKIRVGLLFLAMAVGTELFDRWQEWRAAKQLNVDRESVDIDASVAGMMLVEAWTSCSQIGIVDNLESCAKYQARLLQEQVAPMLAGKAIALRDSYYKKCQRFYTDEYCEKLITRSVEISYAQTREHL